MPRCQKALRLASQRQDSIAHIYGMLMLSPSLKWLSLCLMVLVGAASLAITLETLWGSAGWPRHRLLSQEVAAVVADNAALTTSIEKLMRQIAAQAERPEVQEALVRDLLGYVRPEDVIVRIEARGKGR